MVLLLKGHIEIANVPIDEVEGQVYVAAVDLEVDETAVEEIAVGLVAARPETTILGATVLKIVNPVNVYVSQDGT